MEFIRTNQAPEAIGPYSQAVAAGPFVFCSGQLPMFPGTREMCNASIEEATRQALANLRQVLAEAGCSVTDVVKTTVYLRDLTEFEEMNAVYREFFGEHRPARATLQAARLPGNARVEIECLALRRNPPNAAQ